MAESGYTPIQEYGIVGNLETCALVAPNGSIDRFPFPHVESPSILAAILDDEDGGRFCIEPAEQYETGQQYVETTNVLETTFRTTKGMKTRDPTRTRGPVRLASFRSARVTPAR